MIEPTEEMLSTLRERVIPYYNESRYQHVRAVEEEAAYMAKAVMPEREGSLRAAALLHDIAKKLSYEKQLNYIGKFGIMDTEKSIVRAVAHAAAGAAMIADKFPEYAEVPELLPAVRYHATGHAGMSVFEAIIFLADYIEPTRPYESCKRLRAFFHEGVEASSSRGEKLEVLRRSVVTSLRETISHVRAAGDELDFETVAALSYFEGGGELIYQ